MGWSVALLTTERSLVKISWSSNAHHQCPFIFSSEERNRPKRAFMFCHTTTHASASRGESLSGLFSIVCISFDYVCCYYILLHKMRAQLGGLFLLWVDVVAGPLIYSLFITSCTAWRGCFSRAITNPLIVAHAFCVCVKNHATPPQWETPPFTCYNLHTILIDFWLCFAGWPQALSLQRFGGYFWLLHI